MRRRDKELPGPSKLGQVGLHAGSGNWYLVTHVRAGGVTSGLCVYGPKANSKTPWEGLRSKTELVPKSRLPKKVIQAVAYLALTGKVMVAR